MALGLPHTTDTLSWEDLRISHRVRTLNPKGQVPILQHSKGVLADSTLITIQLCEWGNSLALRGATNTALPGCFGGGGLEWVVSHDALLFRTADVELRDAMMEVYRSDTTVRPLKPATSPDLVRVAQACALFRSLLETSSTAGEPPPPTPGVLHGAFLLNSLLHLLEKKEASIPPSASHLAAVLGQMPLVQQVLLFFGQRNHLRPTGRAS